MSNSLLTISQITKESLRELKNQLGFAKGVNRQYDDKFAVAGAKIGSVINIRKPQRFTVTDGAALVIQNIEDASVPLTLDTQQHVGFQFSSAERALSMDEFNARYIKPAVTALANKVDFNGLALYKRVWNAVGVPRTTPGTLAVALEARRRMLEGGCPADGMLDLVVNPAAEGGFVDGLKGLHQSAEKIAAQYEKGVMGITAGFKFKMDQNVNVHTTGAQGGTPEVATTVSVQGATTIVTSDWTAAAANRLKEGDVFTVADVYAVNPVSKQSTGQLQQFVVTADFDSDGSGNGSVSVLPAMYTTGAKQNINRFPTDEDLITVLDEVTTPGGTPTAVNMAYHRDAFALGCADLPLPEGVDMASRASDPDSGLSIRLVRAYDINNDVFPVRLDILYGWDVLYAELACRIHG